MTTDFLLTLRRGDKLLYLARTNKPSEQLNNMRTIEKFAIEQEFWLQRNVDWAIVTELDLTKEVCRNQAFFHPHYDGGDSLQHASGLMEFLRLTTSDILSEALSEFEFLNDLDKGEGLAIFKHLIATKQVRFDFSTKFTNRIPLSQLELFTVDEVSLRWAR